MMVALLTCAACLPTPSAWAGGGPESVLLIIDPTDQESLYLGHYYKWARRIPDSNVLHMQPAGANYDEHLANQQQVVLGTLRNLESHGHIDFVVVAPCRRFHVSAPGLVTDSCAAVSRFALSSVYTFAHISDRILGGLPSAYDNEYYSVGLQPTAFDACAHWYDGNPSGYPTDPQYFIGALLGYTGERGNTLEELVNMIDRSVAADGTHPAGTFYFMETTDETRSGPRHGTFPGVVAAMESLGGVAEHLEGVLPDRHDCLGVMTGWASPEIRDHDFTLVPGAFCDHLTSYSATFDAAGQVKISEWIAAGASGSVGAVQEPCNYAGKFPHARLHAYYLQGASLGEAAFRSLHYLPFQMLLYGDPLTQPFAHIPIVEVVDLPLEPVSGTITLTAEAQSPNPNASIEYVDVLVDGTWVCRTLPSEPMMLDTARYADGPHELRVVAVDDSVTATTGRWLGTLRTSNHGKSATLSANPTGGGDLRTMFEIAAGSAGGEVREIRLVGAGRTLAAAQEVDQIVWRILGTYLGAGPQTFHAVVEFFDGTVAVSEPVHVDIHPAGESTGPTDDHDPVAFGYTKNIAHNQPLVIELPAADFEGTELSYQIITPPARGTLTGTGATRYFFPEEGASGTDAFTFGVSDGANDSALATVTLRYTFRNGDYGCDQRVDLADVQWFQNCYTSRHTLEPLSRECAGCFDWDADGDVDSADFERFAALFADHTED